MPRFAVALLMACVVCAVPRDLDAARKDDSAPMRRDAAYRVEKRFSMAGWVRPGPLGAPQPLVSLADRQAEDGLLILPDGRVSFGATFPSGWRGVRSRAPLQVGRWTHLAVTFDGRDLLLYVDGVSAGQARIDLSREDRPGLGREPYRLRRAKNALEAAHLYKRVLTASQIAAVMVNTRPVPTDPAPEPEPEPEPEPAPEPVPEPVPEPPPPPPPPAPLPSLDVPALVPVAGTYQGQVRVTLLAAEGTTIRYTVDGSDPTGSSPIYSEPLVISASATVRARATRAGFTESESVSAAYTIAARPPAIVPGTGTFTTPQVVTVAAVAGNGEIRFTTDGSEPTPASPIYGGAFLVDQPLVVKARAYGDGVLASAVSTATLAFRPATPVASPAGGVYMAGQQVSLVAPVGSEIRYTLDGSLPTSTSLPFTGPIDVRASLTLTAVAFKDGWSPSLPLTAAYAVSTDVTAPTITASVSPPPNAHGWHNRTVTVTFACADIDSLLTTCTPSRLSSGDGASLAVVGFARDEPGNVATQTVYVNVDRTAPLLSVFEPLEHAVFPDGTSTVTIRGGLVDLSGIVALTCGPNAGVVDGQHFSCAADVGSGLNVVRVVAEDFAGHVTSRDLSFLVGETPLPAALVVTPATLIVGAGERRRLTVTDEHGRALTDVTWSSDAAAVAEVIQDGGEPTLEARSIGQAQLTASYGSLSASTTVTVLGAGATPEAGSVLWGLGGAAANPMRAAVLQAAPGPNDDPAESAALFFVDEATIWSSGTQARLAGRPVNVRGVAPDGRQLWSRDFATPATIKHSAADNDGGLVIAWSQWQDPATGTFYPERVQRLRGVDGVVSWEYAPVPAAFISDLAIHPDGRTFFTEQRLFGVSALVSVTRGGLAQRWDLPTGYSSTVDTGSGALTRSGASPARPSHPIVTDAGSVQVVIQRSITEKFVSSWFDSSGTRSRDDFTRPWLSASHGDVVEVSEGGGMVTHPVLMPQQEWNLFRPEDYRLMPDGAGGLLLIHRTQPLVGRVARTEGEFRFVGTSRLFDYTGMTTFGTESVLGDDGAQVVVHGLTGSSHWTRALRFDPLSLATTGASLLADRLTAPTHMRLQFALAGGGSHVSGPDNGHGTSIGGGAWAGWVNGPALVAGGTVARAHTEWPSRQGTAQGANAAILPGVGVLAKAHSIALAGRHVAIRIVPRNQSRWLAHRPRDFVHRDSRGRAIATLGAGPRGGDSGSACDGSLTLISEVNRVSDLTDSPSWLEPLRYNPRQEDELIERLFALDAKYADNLPYCLLPARGVQFYNSNSYSAGLLKAAKVPWLFTPTLFLPAHPGWDKPLPASAFGEKP